jgi:acyl-CoA synthetase (AMP-forming)/AMP-acid ligase II
LSRQLPYYMVPSAFLVVEHLPLTSSGKVDRKALGQLPLPQQGKGRYQPRP